MNSKIGAFPFSTSTTLRRLAISTNAAKNRSAEKRLRSKGFPCRYISSADGNACVANHADGAREPAIRSHANGIQSALEVRTVGSRLSRKRPRIPAANTTLAIHGLTRRLPRNLARNGLPHLQLSTANYGAFGPKHLADANCLPHSCHSAPESRRVYDSYHHANTAR